MYSYILSDVQLYTVWCTAIYFLMYSYILSDVQLYSVWCTNIYCPMYSYILSNVQLYSVWCTALYCLLYSYILLSVVWIKVALRHYFLSTLNYYCFYHICFPRALPLITIYLSAPHTPLTLSLTKRNNFISTLLIHVSEYQNLPCAPNIPSVFGRPLSLCYICLAAIKALGWNWIQPDKICENQ